MSQCFALSSPWVTPEDYSHFFNIVPCVVYMTPVVSSYFLSVVELVYGNKVVYAFNNFMSAFVVVEIYLRLIHYNYPNKRVARLIQAVFNNKTFITNYCKYPSDPNDFC